MTFSIKDDLDKLERKLYNFEKGLVPVAATQAINRTTTTVQSRSVKAIAAETGVKQKDVRAGMERIKASRRSLTASIDARQAKAKNLIHHVTPSQRNAQTFRRRVKKGFKHPGVKAKAWGKPKYYDGTFIGRGGGGNARVFRRTSAARLPIEPVFGPSPRKTFDSSKVNDVMKSTTKERLPIELSAAINNQIRKQR
jgi:hypothetical protein